MSFTILKHIFYNVKKNDEKLKKMKKNIKKVTSIMLDTLRKYEFKKQNIKYVIEGKYCKYKIKIFLLYYDFTFIKYYKEERVMDKVKRNLYIFAILIVCVFTFSIVQIMKNKETVLTSSVRSNSS